MADERELPASPLTDADRAEIAGIARDPMEFLRLSAWDAMDRLPDEARNVASEALARLLVHAVRESAGDSDELPEGTAAVAAAVDARRNQAEREAIEHLADLAEAEDA